MSDLVALNIGQIGEKIVLQRGVTIAVGEDVALEGISHPSASPWAKNNVQYGRYGALITYQKDKNVGFLPKGQSAGKQK